MTADELLEQCRAVVPGAWEGSEHPCGVWTTSPEGVLDDEDGTELRVSCEDGQPGGAPRVYVAWASEVSEALVTFPGRTVAEAIRAVRRRLAPEDPWPWPEPTQAPDTLPLTRAALAAYDAHEATECVPGEGLAWVDEHDRLRDAIGAAFAAETADINAPAVAATVADSRAGLAFVRRCVEEDAAELAAQPAADTWRALAQDSLALLEGNDFDDPDVMEAYDDLLDRAAKLQTAEDGS